MSVLIVITGPPGAGKSTVASRLSQAFSSSALLRGDDFFAMLDQGFIEPWTEASHRQNAVVIDAAAAAAGTFAAGGYTVVYDGVIGPWFLEAFVAATRLPEIHYAMLLPSEEQCIQRVSTRTGHEFTDLDAARHMYREFATATIDERHILRSEEPAEAIAAAVQQLVDERALVWQPT